MTEKTAPLPVTKNAEIARETRCNWQRAVTELESKHLNFLGNRQRAVKWLESEFLIISNEMSCIT